MFVCCGIETNMDYAETCNKSSFVTSGFDTCTSTHPRLALPARASGSGRTVAGGASVRPGTSLQDYSTTGLI